MQSIEFHIPELDSMKKYPKELFFIGDTSLIHRTKVSIIGSRSPNQYARQLTHDIASKLSQKGVCIVSGGALGVDSIAHKASGADNTIMVAGTGLDKRYPTINKNLIIDIENSGLVLSQFTEGTPSQRYNFPIRNELVVALGDVIIVTYADFKSGSLRSVEYALKMGKEIFVLPHRVGESDGTNDLLSKGLAKAIYNIDEFLLRFGSSDDNLVDDEYMKYFRTTPSYEEAVALYPSKLFEYELSGKIIIQNGVVKPS